MSGYVDVVFDGPPGPVPGRFVEVELDDGRSGKFGEWLQRDDGYWVLRIPTPTPGARRIADERRRQIEEEGLDAEHDDGHPDGALARAGITYAVHAVTPELHDMAGPPAGWPWHRDWWKPSDDPVRNLEKAGALIAAELDRYLRLP